MSPRGVSSLPPPPCFDKTVAAASFARPEVDKIKTVATARAGLSTVPDMARRATSFVTETFGFREVSHPATDKNSV